MTLADVSDVARQMHAMQRRIHELEAECEQLHQAAQAALFALDGLVPEQDARDRFAALKGGR